MKIIKITDIKTVGEWDTKHEVVMDCDENRPRFSSSCDEGYSMNLRIDDDNSIAIKVNVSELKSIFKSCIDWIDD